MCVEVRSRLVGVSFLPPPGGFWRWNSGHQNSFLTEPSHWLLITLEVCTHTFQVRGLGVVTGVDQQCLRARAEARQMAVERPGDGMLRPAAIVHISKGK